MNLSVILTEEEAEWLRYALQTHQLGYETRHLDRVVQEIDSAFWRNNHTCWRCLSFKDDDGCESCENAGNA